LISHPSLHFTKHSKKPNYYDSTLRGRQSSTWSKPNVSHENSHSSEYLKVLVSVEYSTDLQAQQILQMFGSASALVIIFEKISVHPINYTNVDLMNIRQPFQGSCKMSPYHYLGLQLHTRRLRKNHIHHLVENIGEWLTDWKGQLLNRAGRLTLVTSVLSSIAIYHMSTPCTMG
jgi:hypothetical protein